MGVHHHRRRHLRALHLITNQLAIPWFVLIVLFSAVILQAFLVRTRMLTGALWLAIGWHAAWDWSEYQVVSLGSGSGAGSGGGNFLLHVRQSGPLLYTGQPGLIEAGLMAGFVTVLCLAVALLVRHRIPHPWAAHIPDDTPYPAPKSPAAG